MMMMVAARRQLNLVGINLWQTGIRSLFRFYQLRSDKSQDAAWAMIREKLEVSCPDAPEWEYQEIRAILYEEINVTLEMAEGMYNRYPNSTPLLDALKDSIAEL